MTPTWLSLLPPLLVLISAYFTKNLNRSLTFGILTATLIATHGALVPAALRTFTLFIEQVTDIEKLYLYGFLLCISIFITLLNHTGDAIAFAQSFTKKIHTKRGVETTSIGLSLLLFIDDYLGNLTVGYVMRPMIDRFSISRAKLAYLIDSLAGPLVILMPISSWVAMITTQLYQAGISPEVTTQTKIIGEPFIIFLYTIPFIFYSLILIPSLFFIVYKQLSYGPMALYEKRAAKSSPDQYIQQTESTPSSSPHGLIIPLATLVSAVFFGILYAGGFSLLGGTRSFVGALQNNTQTELILFLSGIATVGISTLYGIMRKKLRPSDTYSIIKKSGDLMMPAIIMIILASILGMLLKEDLATGTYLGTTILHAVPLAFLPCMLFIVSVIMGLITGSSWGTISILVPIGIQMLLSLLAIDTAIDPTSIPILWPILGAIFSGAVCGDHISPISETTIMAATSSGCPPLEHSYTQFPYAFPALLSSALAFLCAGFLIPYGIKTTLLVSLIAGLISCFTLIILNNRLYWSKRGTS